MKTERKIFIGGLATFLVGGASLAIGVRDNVEINEIVNPQVDQAKGALSYDELNSAKLEIKAASGEITKLVDVATWNKWSNILDTTSIRTRIAEIQIAAGELDDKLDDDLKTLDKEVERKSYASTLREPFKDRDERNVVMIVGGFFAFIIGGVVSIIFRPCPQ